MAGAESVEEDFSLTTSGKLEQPKSDVGATETTVKIQGLDDSFYVVADDNTYQSKSRKRKYSAIKEEDKEAVGLGGIPGLGSLGLFSAAVDTHVSDSHLEKHKNPTTVEEKIADSHSESDSESSDSEVVGNYAGLFPSGCQRDIAKKRSKEYESLLYEPALDFSQPTKMNTRVFLRR